MHTSSSHNFLYVFIVCSVCSVCSIWKMIDIQLSTFLKTAIIQVYFEIGNFMKCFNYHTLCNTFAIICSASLISSDSVKELYEEVHRMIFPFCKFIFTILADTTNLVWIIQFAHFNKMLIGRILLYKFPPYLSPISFIFKIIVI